MLKYLITLLDDTSVSFCHYEVPEREHKLISLEDLKRGIIYGMKHKLSIQFVYPDYVLPDEYKQTIDTIDHADISPEGTTVNANVTVLEHWRESIPEDIEGKVCIIRCGWKEIAERIDKISDALSKVARLNIIITDISSFDDNDIEEYRRILNELSTKVRDRLANYPHTQINILTDRMILRQMNNCNAGVESITLAPNGKFYLCPAFYYDNPEDSVGSLAEGLDIKNRQLLDLQHAPLCRRCDAFQCKRCIWMNTKLTMDANTPSHQQCVMSHLERNASRELQISLKNNNIKIRGSREIPENKELDPFNTYNRWQ